MKINLIPPCDAGISYGSDVVTEAISRFRKQLLAVMVVCSEDKFEYSGDYATPENITVASIIATITLFREPGTIGQVTGFIHETGININLSGTGGRFGAKFMKCLTDNEVQPWFYSSKKVAEQMIEWSGNPEFCLDELPLDQRLAHWERFIINVIAPQLYTGTMSIFSSVDRTGTWHDSWQAGDV